MLNVEDLYKLEFKDEITNKPNGILEYYLIKEESNEVFLQICIKNSDIYPTLIIRQYNWSEMEDNITYLPMINTQNIEALKTDIELLRKLFVI
jgi:hypothetical protein